MKENSPLYVDGMVFNKDNPYRYVPAMYFNYTLKTGEGHVAFYNSDGTINTYSIDGKGNLTEKLIRMNPIDIAKYSGNAGFTQLPRGYAQESIIDALGNDYGTQFWNMLVTGNGTFLTDKPLTAIGNYWNDSPHVDITFRFRTDFKMDGSTYHMVLNVYYGKK
jgi:hypothetical protein